MSNLVRRSCFLNRRCDRLTAKKDAVSLLKQNCRLLESGNETRKSGPVERSVRGGAPQFLGYEDVGVINKLRSILHHSSVLHGKFLSGSIGLGGRSQPLFFVF